MNISLGAFLYAKGNGWDDVDENFRFDFGVDTSFSGSIQIFAKNLNLPASDVFASQIDLFGYNEGPLQQLQSGFLTIGNNEGDMIVAEGPLPGTSADNTIYEEWIEGLSLLGIHIDTLSAGDITFNDLNPGDAKDLGLIGGAGNMAFRTQFDSGGISVTDLTDIIGSLDGGDVFMVAGSGGITVGEIDIENEDRTGDPGQIILATANGGDISTYSLIVESGNREIVSISSSGDVLIDGGVHVATNEVPDSIDKTATAEICIDAGDDITINGPIEADAHGKVEMITSIHIDAGLDAESNDDGESQAGIINIDLGNNGQIVAVAEESGPDPDGTNDLYSEATIEIHTSAVDTQDEDAINIIGGASGGNQAVRVRAKVQGESPVGDSMPGDDPTSYSDERIGSDGDILKSQIVLVEIESGVDYDQPDYSDCDNCVKPPFLPPTPEFFLVKNDAATVDWRAGYTIIGDGSYDPADLDVLLNDNGPGVPLYDAAIIIDSLVTEKGGTLEWVEFQYTDGDGVTHIYDGFVYTPPSYTEDFEWDGVSDYATFTDSFQYQGYKQESDSLSLNTATVTLTVQNEVPTLAGDSDTIHMNTSSDFDLSTLATDNDGTPGELTGEFTGTYGDLSYDIVEGLIPVADGTIATDSSLIPDTLTISGDMITYAPLDGYVSPTGESTTFGYTVSDDNIKGATFELPEGEYLDVTVTNTLPGGDVTLSDAPMNASGETVTKTGGNDFTDADSDPFAIVSIDPATDDYNKTYGGTLSYNGNEDPYVSGNTYDYTADAALPGYVGEDDFDATLWDGQTTYYADGSSAVLSTDYGQGTIDLDVVNDRPEGDSWLGTTSMDTALTDVELATDGFSDINGDTFSIEIDGVSSDDYNGDFGGSLNYNGSDYDYDPTAMDLPGYTGDDIDDFDDGGYVIPDNADDRFDVKLWDGEYAYTFDDQGGFERTAQYGEGSISVDITNELPESDAWFGQVHMDSQGVTQGLEVDFAPSITVDADTYTGSVIGSDNYGGTLEFDGTTWTYSTDTTLPGYVGDDNDDFGQGAYVADDLFSVNLSNGQYDYWFSEEPAPDGYEYYAPEDIYRKAVFSDGTGTVSVDITNVLPTIDENTTIEHMNEDILNQLFAADQLDPNPNDGLDSLSVLGSTISDFGIPVTVTQNPDGSLSYTYDPADGFVNEDSFDITVWDGQRDYVFNDNGEIVSDNPVTVDGAVSLEYTNITPTGTGDLDTTESGTTLTVAQSGTTS
ncbi:MAG: Ig-like domain-containing protein, partial [Planctomycetota bacterium]